MSTAPRIYYLMGNNVISGGEKHSYEHVDILNECGFDCYALHVNGTRHTWFNNQTRVIDGQLFWDMFDPIRDYLVISETLGKFIHWFPGKKVIFNKNLYIGFKALGLVGGKRRSYYSEPRVVAGFAVSNHNYQSLAFTFPKIRLFRMYSHIDCDMFAYQPFSKKKRRIAVVAKAEESLSVLFHILKARAQAGLNNLSTYEWTFLRDYTHDQVREILEESLMLITLSTHEGLPRTVLEAMSSGCIVIGYGTGPLKECLIPEYQFEPDDFLAMAQRIESVTRAFPENIDSWTPCTIAARKIAEEFTVERQKRHVIEAWEQILTSA